MHNLCFEAIWIQSEKNISSQKEDSTAKLKVYGQNQILQQILQIPISWSPSLRGTIKFNSNVAWKENQSQASVAVIAKNSKVEIIDGLVKKINCATVFSGEALATYEAIKLARAMGFVGQGALKCSSESSNSSIFHFVPLRVVKIMQAPKGRSGSSEAPQKVRPGAVRQLKTTGLESDSSSPSNQLRTPKDRTPKAIDRRSPRSPVTEKKRPSRISELESQISQLHEELSKAKDQLNLSESWKKEALQDAEESKKQLLAISTKLEESQKQLQELSTSEEARGVEIQKISEERDRAWQSELEAIQHQHLVDSAALGSALSEIQQLKVQLEMVAESEATQTNMQNQLIWSSRP
ncbi:hypothetical protein GH714_003279 [Hevea brasiliensis]|uniref:RNase H type-1 domain-containing protein n=1 Tax=Hevea brasiliensis TaxID=3981 RepID=A0A6A6N6S8_HEVBR|nr:hypothetical protein GH714_003279 [Hevea brasiliensis]